MREMEKLKWINIQQNIKKQNGSIENDLDKKEWKIRMKKRRKEEAV